MCLYKLLVSADIQRQLTARSFVIGGRPAEFRLTASCLEAAYSGTRTVLFGQNSLLN